MIKSKFIVPIPKRRSKIDEDDALARPSLMLLVGGVGQGKTTLLANLLLALEKQDHDWDQALFVTGNMKDDLLKSIEMSKTSNPSDLEDFITKISQPDTEARYNLLCLDDLQGNPDFNIALGRSSFSKFIISHRHHGKVDNEGGTWVIATAQTYKNSYSTTFRKNVQLYFIWYPRDLDELKSIETVSGDPVKMKQALRLLKLEPNHQFLFVNKSDPTNVRYFLGFDRELFF